MPSSSQRPLRVLCLHGLTENAKVMEKKLRPTMERLSPLDFEFVFISAPYILPQVSKIDSHHGTNLDLKSNVLNADNIEYTTKVQDSCFAITYNRALEQFDYAQERRLKPRKVAGISELKAKYSSMIKNLSCQKVKEESEEKIFDLHGDGKRWWTIPNEVKGKGMSFIGQEASFQVISKAMQEYGPFDGVIGYSTGAMMAAFVQSLLTGLVSMESEPTFQPPANQEPFKFAIYFAPWLPATGVHASYINEADQDNHYRPIPTLCFQGVNDRSVGKGTCPEFARRVRSERFEYHNGGHSIPFWDKYPDFLSRWLSIASQEVQGKLSSKQAKKMRLTLPSPYTDHKKQGEARL